MRVAALIGSLVQTLVVSAVAFAVLAGGLAALIFLGPSLVDPVCGDREVTRAPALSRVFQAKWQSLLSGSQAINFTESEASTRAGDYLSERSSAFRDAVICFGAAGGGATARALIDVSFGGLSLGSIFVEAGGTADLSGTSPAVSLSNVRLGRLPGFLSNRIGRPTIERAINAQALTISTPGGLDVRFRDGDVVVVRPGG